MPRRAPAPAYALAATRAWVERAVIGLGLCPYARAAQAGGRVRYVCSAATHAQALLADLAVEVRRLLATAPGTVETTLLVHPWALGEFEAYNDFLDLADAALEALGALGVLQVASFHPRYRFAGSDADDVANATNRSPYPMLQLLREASVAAAVDAGADGEAIAAANVARLRRLGEQRWRALMARCAADALSAMPPARRRRPKAPR
jgi:hypothetical protein